MESLLKSIKELKFSSEDYSKILIVLSQKCKEIEFKDTSKKRSKWSDKLDEKSKNKFDKITKKKSPYNIFIQDNKETIKQEKKDDETFMSTAHRLFDDLTDDEEEVYNNKSKKSKKKYEKDIKEWVSEFPDVIKHLPKSMKVILENN